MHRGTFISENLKKYKNENVAAWLALFHSYTGFSGFASYLFVFLKKAHISIQAIIFCSTLLLLVIYQSIHKPFNEILLDFRYYWGWLLFYVIFKEKLLAKRLIRNAVILLSVLTLIEVFAINFILGPENLPNFPKSIQHIEQYTMAAQGEYQRPYSFAGIPTAGSVLLVVMMVISNLRGWQFWLGAIAIFSIASGTGIYAFLIMLSTKYKNFLLIFIFLIILMMTYTLIIDDSYFDYLINMYSQKIGGDYIKYLYQFKVMQTEGVIQQTNLSELIFGGASGGELDNWIGHGADFGYLSYLAIYGILGCLLFILFVLNRINKANCLPLMIILISSMHYGVLNTIPGQMVLGLLLAMGRSGLPES